MEETLLLLILIIASDFNVKKKRKKRTKRFWMRKWLAMRHEKSSYYNILAELQNSDTEHYRNYLRMNHETFQVILMTFISSFDPVYYVLREICHREVKPMTCLWF